MNKGNGFMLLGRKPNEGGPRYFSNSAPFLFGPATLLQHRPQQHPTYFYWKPEGEKEGIGYAAEFSRIFLASPAGSLRHD